MIERSQIRVCGRDHAGKQTPACHANLHHVHACFTCLDRHGWLTKASADIGVLTTIISWREVVADGEIWSDVSAGVRKGRTLVGGTSNFFGVSPGDLGEVAPGVEVAHIWVVLTV
jgi:hypothetical protein